MPRGFWRPSCRSTAGSFTCSDSTGTTFTSTCRQPAQDARGRPSPPTKVLQPALTSVAPKIRLILTTGVRKPALRTAPEARRLVVPSPSPCVGRPTVGPRWDR